MKDPIASLEEMEAKAALGGGEERIDKQHEAGKLTARERIELLLDPGTFVELDKFVTHRCADFGMEEQKILGDGVVTGYGTVDGRLVFVFAQDFTVFGGSLSGAYAQKICKVMDLAMKIGAPGHRPQRLGRRAHPGRRRVARRLRRHLPAQHARLAASCRRSRAIMGPCAGGAVYSPAITDFIFMVEDTSLHVHHRPRRHQDGDARGGDEGGRSAARTTHATKSRRRALRRARRAGRASRGSRELLSFLPVEQPRGPAGRSRRDDPADREDAALDTIVPRESEQALRHQGDHPRASSTTGTSSRSHEHYAQNIVVGFARLDGRAGRHRRQPAGASRRLPRHRRVDEGRALRALLRLLQHPARHVRRRARLPARHRPGVRRHHQARREAALRVRRGDGAEDHGHHAQGLRRRLRRHGVQAHPRRRQLRVSRPPRSR